MGLTADLAAETEARIGGENYPASFMEYFPGKDLTELLPIEQPPGGRRPSAASGKEDDDDELDGDADVDGDAVDDAGLAAWAHAKASLTPEELHTQP